MGVDGLLTRVMRVNAIEIIVRFDIISRFGSLESELSIHDKEMRRIYQLATLEGVRAIGEQLKAQDEAREDLKREMREETQASRKLQDEANVLLKRELQELLKANNMQVIY